MSRDASRSAGASDARLPVAATYFGVFVLLGFMLTAIGPSLDELEARSGSTTAAVSLLFAANALGYIAGSLLGGRLYARRRGHLVMSAALLVLALLAVAVPLVRGLGPLLLVFGLVGVPLGLMDVGGNTLLVWLYRADVPPYMNALHLSFAVGAFAGPLVIDRFAVATGDPTLAFGLVAAMLVPLAVRLARLESPVPPAAPAAVAGAPAVVRRHAPFVVLMAAFFFFHMGAEMAFGGWIYSYADGLAGSTTTARLVNSAFWGGLIAGRLVAIPLAVRLAPATILLADLAGSLASLALLLAVPGSTPALWLGTIGFGVAVASLIPTSFTFTERRIPIVPQVSSALLVGGSIGTMTLPWLIGQAVGPLGSSPMLLVPGVALLAALVLAVSLVRAERPAPASPSLGEASTG